MRAARLAGLTLTVLAAHVAAWRWTAAGGTRTGTARGGGVRVVRVSARPVAASAAIAPFDPRPAARPVVALRPPIAARVAPHRAMSPPGAPPIPTYPTRPPPSATLAYRLGASDGRAELAWTLAADGFDLRLAVHAAGRAAREWRSVGTFDAAGTAPSRLVERDGDRDRRAVDFDRAAGLVRFAGAAPPQPLVRGAQDQRWSWIAQLAAIAEAAPAPVAPGTVWALAVAGLRGDVDRWVFRVQPDAGLPAESAVPGKELSSPDDRAPALLHVVREPERPYDLRVEAWLAPALHHLPVALRLSTPPSGWQLALWPVDDGVRRDP